MKRAAARRGGLLGVIASAAVLMASPGCASLAAPLTPPERGGPPWVELTSKHFVLATDVEEAEAREALGEFETVFTALQSVAFSPDIEPRPRILVVLFHREQDYDRFAPAHTAGYFTARLPNDIDVAPTMVMWGSLVNRTRLVFQHELTHLFVRWTLASAPRWLNEGLAEFYSTFELKDGEAILGSPLPDRGLAPVGEVAWRSVRVEPWDRVLIPVVNVPSVEQIVGGGPEEFALSSVKGLASIDESRLQTAYYFGAWALVHLLYTVPEYRARFNQMVAAVAEGKSAREAWDERFRDVPPDKLETDFREHLLRIEKIEGHALATKYSPPPPASPEMARPLSPSGVHLLWARLRSWHTDAPRALARPDIEAARALEPGSPEVEFWSALFHISERRYEEAEVDITQALEQRPNDARYLMTLVHVVSAAHGTLALDRIGALMANLEKVAVSSKALDFVASDKADQNKIEEGLRFATRAIKADRTCFRCYETLARLYHAKGDIEEAAAAVERAQNLLPDGLHIPDLDERVRQYVKERDQARRARGLRRAPEGAPPQTGGGGAAP